MDDISQTQTNDGMLQKAGGVQREEIVSESAASNSAAVGGSQGQSHEETGARGFFGRKKKDKRRSYSHAHFKVYKRRWFGLAQLVLLNIVVSWDVSTFSFSSARSKIGSSKLYLCPELY